MNSNYSCAFTKKNKLMKSKFLFLLFLLSITGFAQTINGIITYKVFTNEELKNSITAKTVGESAMNMRKDLTFTLKFNKEEAIFTADPLPTADQTQYKNALVSCDIVGVYMKDFKSNVVFKYRDDDEFGKIAVKSTSPIQWELLNEKKVINGYECYLAKANYMLYEYKIIPSPITAWYCPKIPVSIGPKNYDGLPGLIMEITDWRGTFGVSKMDLNPKEVSVDFKKDKYKIITDKEFSDLIIAWVEGK
jgi:GLPGLI family protein